MPRTKPAGKQLTPSPPSVRAEPDFPSLEWESVFWDCDIRCVAGVDEVGRGAMAGPLVAAAVILPADRREDLLDVLSGVRDSKVLTHERRVELLARIESVAQSVGIGVVPVDELDGMGLGAANRIAMERAVLQLDVEAEALLVDACVIDLALPQVGPIDGDALSLSIAAASIVAKVTRDRMMIDLAGKDVRFGFELHKGYCSPLHKARLAEHGPSVHHRRCFSPVASWERAS
ncbi:MAG: ribonuclease HII [Thermomicrobiales bacterium]